MWWWSNTAIPQSLKILKMNKPWKSLKIIGWGLWNPGRGKYTASCIWNRRFLNLLENLGSPGKILEFHIKLGVGTLAINFIPPKINGLSKKVHTPSQRFLVQQRRKLLGCTNSIKHFCCMPLKIAVEGEYKKKKPFYWEGEGAIKEVTSLCRSWWVPEENSCFDQTPWMFSNHR